jgi:CAF1 family ribonuclease
LNRFRHPILRSQILESADNFIVNQFGLATFTAAPGGGYVVKTFNFNLFPRDFRNDVSTVAKVFSSEAGSLEYLAQHKFDFNKMVYKGVPFMPLATQERLLKVCSGLVARCGPQQVTSKSRRLSATDAAQAYEHPMLRHMPETAQTRTIRESCMKGAARYAGGRSREGIPAALANHRCRPRLRVDADAQRDRVARVEHRRDARRRRRRERLAARARVLRAARTPPRRRLGALSMHLLPLSRDICKVRMAARARVLGAVRPPPRRRLGCNQVQSRTLSALRAASLIGNVRWRLSTDNATPCALQWRGFHMEKAGRWGDEGIRLTRATAAEAAALEAQEKAAKIAAIRVRSRNTWCMRTLCVSRVTTGLGSPDQIAVQLPAKSLTCAGSARPHQSVGRARRRRQASAT